MMSNSFHKFHPDIELITYGREDFDRETKRKEFTDTEANIPDHDDNLFRLTPLFARNLLREYELVVRLDADQIITGDLNYIIDHRKEYDLGTVLNINRIDPLKYKPCELSGILPNEYYNLGTIAFTHQRFVEHLWKLCNSRYFWKLQYREQDLLNLMAHYGDYRVKCFDNYDVKNNYYAWHGLVAKGETVNSKLVKEDGKYKVIIPKGADNYPDHDITLKILHFAGGAYEKKYNYDLHFQGEVLHYVEWLVSDSKEDYDTWKIKNPITI